MSCQTIGRSIYFSFFTCESICCSQYFAWYQHLDEQGWSCHVNHLLTAQPKIEVMCKLQLQIFWMRGNIAALLSTRQSVWGGEVAWLIYIGDTVCSSVTRHPCERQQLGSGYLRLCRAPYLPLGRRTWQIHGTSCGPQNSKLQGKKRDKRRVLRKGDVGRD